MELLDRQILSDRYKHLTNEEICVIAEQCRKNKNNLVNFKERINKAQKQYSDLVLLEDEIKNKLINPIAQKNTRWDFGNIYLQLLVYYNRITVPMEVLVNMNINRRLILSIDPEINSMYIKFKQVTDERLNSAHADLCFNDVIKVLLYYSNLPKRDVIKKLRHVCKDFNIKGKFSDRIGTAIKVYEILGVNFDIDTKEYSHIKNLQSVISSQEFIYALKIYLDYLDNFYATKTVKTLKSHLKCFFAFLDTNYREINKFDKIDNKHVKAFIREQIQIRNWRNKSNANSTINHRLQAVKAFLEYCQNELGYNIKRNIITKYDQLKEHDICNVTHSKQDVIKLLQAINKIDSRYVQIKLILLILFDTGRRIHEVLILDYNCITSENRVHFHKIKQQVSHTQIVGDITIKSILQARELVKTFDEKLYSKYDKQYRRRLFASRLGWYKNIVSISLVEKVFKKIQIENGIVDNNNKPLFKLHDLKRNYVRSMENAGMSVSEISQVLNQSVETLKMYEGENTAALKCLAEVGKSGLLIGKDIKIQSKRDDELTQILFSKDIIERNSINLMESIKNPKENIPLPLGGCLSGDDYLTCGMVFCLECKKFIIANEDDILEFEKYCEKFFRYYYQFKRSNEVIALTKKFEQIAQDVFTNKCGLTIKEAKKKITSIKKGIRISLKGRENE